MERCGRERINSHAERFVHHLRQVDPRNVYDAESHLARVFIQAGSEESALFQLDPEAVSAYLDKLLLEASSLWPEVPPELRAFRLLSIHLSESVRDDPDEVFIVTPTGISPFVG